MCDSRHGTACGSKFPIPWFFGGIPHKRMKFILTLLMLVCVERGKIFGFKMCHITNAKNVIDGTLVSAFNLNVAPIVS